MSFIPRVTQLDAGYLDDQVAELFNQQLLEITKFLEPGILQPILPELELILRSWIFKYSIYNKKCTFGQQMLSLQYKNDNFSKSKLIWYYAFTVGFKYLRERAIYSFTNHTRIQNLVSNLETFHLVADIFNFLRFIQNGKYPSLIDFILGLEMSADKITREDLTDFAWTRELLWHNFIELIGTSISLMNIFGLKSRILGLLKYVRRDAPVARTTSIGPPRMDQNTVCAVCASSPLLPHTMGCSHVFCYYCIMANKTADKDFPCPKCHYNGSQVLWVI